MQNLKTFNRFYWRCSLNQTMHHENRTHIAFNDFRSIFLSYLNLINSFKLINYFWSTMLSSQMSISRNRIRSDLFVKLNSIDELFDESIFKKKHFMFFLNIANHYLNWFVHQYLLVHVSYKILLFKINYEHESKINKWHINNVVEEHSSLFFVDAINDEYDLIFFDQHQIVWYIDYFVRKRDFI